MLSPFSDSPLLHVYAGLLLIIIKLLENGMSAFEVFDYITIRLLN